MEHSFDTYIIRHPIEKLQYFVFYDLNQFTDEIKDFLKSKDINEYLIEKHKYYVEIETLSCQK